MRSLIEALNPKSLKVLHRIAKDPGKGALPFFRNPKAMIELREAAQRCRD